MNREAMEKWIAALEDPVNEGRQVRGTYANHDDGVCAVGLAMEIFDVNSTTRIMDKLAGVDDLLARHEVLRINVGGRRGASVTYANDNGWSFWDIAQALRATHLKETT